MSDLKWNGPFRDDPKFANDTHIVCVIDKSGSMAGKESDVIGGFNKFLAEQKALPGFAYLTMIQFDHEYDVKFNRVPIQHVADLNTDTYKPRGNTALLDAIGKAINSVAWTDKKVQVLVITDGEENCSSQYRKETITNLIKLKTEAGWSFVYLGAGVNSFRDATSIGFHANNVVTYANTGIGTQAAYATLTASASQFRSTGHATMDSNFLTETYNAAVSEAKTDAAKTA